MATVVFRATKGLCSFHHSLCIWGSLSLLGSTWLTFLSLSLNVTSEVPFLTVQALALAPWSSLPCSLIFCFPYSACSYFIYKLTWSLSLQPQVQDGRSESASFTLLSLHPRQGFECVRVIPEAECNRDKYWGGTTQANIWPNVVEAQLLQNVVERIYRQEIKQGIC